MSAAAGPVYRYRLNPLGHGSDRYGPCEVCRQRCDSVYIQTEEREFILPDCVAAERGVSTGWTQAGCYTLFGHRECLTAKQR